MHEKREKKVSIRRVRPALFALQLQVGLTGELRVRAGLQHDGCTVIDLIGRARIAF